MDPGIMVDTQVGVAVGAGVDLGIQGMVIHGGHGAIHGGKEKRKDLTPHRSEVVLKAVSIHAKAIFNLCVGISPHCLHKCSKVCGIIM